MLAILLSVHHGSRPRLHQASALAPVQKQGGRHERLRKWGKSMNGLLVSSENSMHSRYALHSNALYVKDLCQRSVLNLSGLCRLSGPLLCCNHLTVQLLNILECQMQVDQMIQQEQSISTPGEAANLQAAKQESESNPNLAGR